MNGMETLSVGMSTGGIVNPSESNKLYGRETGNPEVRMPLPPLPGQQDENQQHVDGVPIRITIQGQHFYLDKTDALDLASTILMTIRATMINE